MRIQHHRNSLLIKKFNFNQQVIDLLNLKKYILMYHLEKRKFKQRVKYKEHQETLI